MSEHHQTVAPSEEQGFNREEINAKLIIGLTVATILFVFVSIFGLRFMVDRHYEDQIFTKVLQPVAADLQDLRARETEQLGAYKYIDREKGVVNLPISRAMELLAAEHAAGTTKYPTTPYPVKTEEEAAAND